MAVGPAARPGRVEAFGVVLRPYGPADRDDLLAAFADPDIARWNPGPTGDRGVEEFVERRNDWSPGDHASWAVADPSDRLVGSVSVHRIDVDQADAEIGYWVAPWARRQGFGTRGVRAAAQFAFGPLRLHRLYLHHAVDNPGSCAVARSAGFELEGTLRESYRYPDGEFHDEHLHGRLAGDDARPA